MLQKHLLSQVTRKMLESHFLKIIIFVVLFYLLNFFFIAVIVKKKFDLQLLHIFEACCRIVGVLKLDAFPRV